MNNIKRIFFSAWRGGVLIASLSLIAYLLYYHRIGSLVPGYSTPELQALAHSANWHTIASNPINAPFTIIVWLGTAILHHGILVTRVVTATFGVLAALAFFLIIRPWYNFRVSFLSTILFATSAGLLHQARFGSGQILQMGILAFIGMVLWYRRQKKHRIIIGYGVAVLCALLWYIPGLLWFEIFGLILLRAGFVRQLRTMPRLHIAGWSLTALVVLLPLVVACLRTPHLLLSVGGLPPTVASLSHFPANLLHAVLSIGVTSTGNPLLWVGHAPLLNVIELVLGIIGVYFYLFQERSIRTVFLVGSAVLSLLLISLGGSVGFACLIPVLYLFVASGLDHLLQQWLSVFPRNPIARFIGIVIICGMLFFSVLYQVRSYFVAWPHTKASRQAFDHPAP